MPAIGASGAVAGVRRARSPIGLARLVMDSPAELRTGAPVLNGSGGPRGAAAAPLPTMAGK